MEAFFSFFVFIITNVGAAFDICRESRREGGRERERERQPIGPTTGNMWSADCESRLWDSSLPMNSQACGIVSPGTLGNY